MTSLVQHNIEISVIIVNYNTKTLLQECLDSIYKHSKDVNFEVIVVDNGSIDGSVELFKTDERILFIQNEQNDGFGRANNLGLKYAKGNFILFLNSDTIFRNNALLLFYKQMKSMPQEVVCLGALLRNGNGNITHSYGKFPMWYDEFKFLAKEKRIEIQSSKAKFPIEVDYVTGANLFMRKRVLEQYGAFDPDFFLYYEETEMLYRFSKKGLKSYIIDGPDILHLEGQSSKKTGFKKRLIMTQSYLLFFRKTLPASTFAFVKGIIFIKRLPSILFFTPVDYKRKYLKIFYNNR